jgi:two-component system, OmpR family, sensor kinase
MINSLRGRLFVGFTAIIILTGAMGGSLAYKWAYSEAIEVQDSVLVQVGAFALNASVRQSQPVNGIDRDSEIAVVELGNAPHGPADDRQLWRLKDGLHSDVYQGQPVRVLLRTRPDGSRFAVTQSTEIRSELAGNMALRTLLPIAALVPCLMLVTVVVIAGSLRPMSRLANDLDARRADDVGQLPAVGAPSELQPFLGSINGLLGRLHTMIDQQRRFIADAAHELRTPVTALSLQADNLDLAEMPAAARDRLQALKTGISRTKHLLEQLLTLAYQEAAPASGGETAQLDKIAKEVVAGFLPEAAARNVDLGFTVAESVAVEGEPQFLISAIRNLVQNALKFTPESGRVDLGIYREGGQAVFRIEDTGPGIPPDDLDRILEPFFRGRRATGEGSGLGLSIVKRIVDRSGGTIAIENIAGRNQTGLRVTVRLRLVRCERT